MANNFGDIEDGFPATKLFTQGYSYTYDDVIFLPHFIDFPADYIRIIHSNNTPSEQASLIRSAKSHRIMFVSTEIPRVCPNDSILSASAFDSSPCVFVTENGSQNNGRLLGVVDKSVWDNLVDKEARSSKDEY
ncbi:hypothetical protein L1987_16736 [Smallanthus sonchifolius]|uniref:Uncharacterized protein n=1 Tax=Smallanthus sonchifolius TaxID=185202 RepID=A0ACB9IWY9_9ASTR|nr:hypothetical protein L1987_16736 [Smallanthus sonchifolius]